MKLNTAEVIRIADREAKNAGQRERQRAKWAADAAARAPVVSPIRTTIIPFGEHGQLGIGRNAYFRFGPLNFVLPKFDEAAIAEAFMRLQHGARTWPDGTMRGIKRLVRVDRGEHKGRWKSPSMGTIWSKDGTCSATDFADDEQLRGHAGVHAVWPDKLDELPHYDGVVVELAGWGQCTVGDIGWRAQHAKVVRALAIGGKRG